MMTSKHRESREWMWQAGLGGDQAGQNRPTDRATGRDLPVGTTSYEAAPELTKGYDRFRLDKNQ